MHSAEACYCNFDENILSLLFFSELDEGKMTVGKIYAGLLIAENWKAYKASQSANSNYRMVREQLTADISRVGGGGNSVVQPQWLSISQAPMSVLVATAPVTGSPTSKCAFILPPQVLLLAFGGFHVPHCLSCSECPCDWLT